MKEIKNVSGNLSQEYIEFPDAIHVHTNIIQDQIEPNIYHYDEFVFGLDENPKDLIDYQDNQLAELMDDIEQLCNELIGE